MSFDASEIARLRALCAAATPGLWRDYFKVTTPDATVVVAYGPECSSKWPDGRATAEFIAAARTALPAALDEIERLREETLQDMKDALKQAYRQVGEAMSSVATPRVLLPLDETPLAKDNARLRKMITDLGLDPDAGVAK